MIVRDGYENELADLQWEAETGRRSLNAFGAGINEQRDLSALCASDYTWNDVPGLAIEDDEGLVFYAAIELERGVPIVRLMLDREGLTNEDLAMAIKLMFKNLVARYGEAGAWISDAATNAHEVVRAVGMVLTERPNTCSDYSFWTYS
jgi:hypothetical protein